MTRFRWLPFASLAVLAHAGLAVVLASPPNRPEIPPPGEQPSPDVAIVELEPAAPEQQPADPQLGPVASNAAIAPVARAAALREEREIPGVPSQEATPAEPEPGPLAPEPSPSSDSDWTFNPAAPLNPASHAVIARAVEPTVREFGSHLSGSNTGGVAEALTARDLDLGLGQGGQVLSAFEERARTMDVAVEGWAVFDVGIDSSGHVSVWVSDASTARDAWERVARTAVADVDAKRIHVPRGARGWHVAVRVEAKEQYPDGERPKDMGGHVTTTEFKESKTSMVMESVPSVTVATRGKVCSAGISWAFPSPVPMIVGGCNPENAGVQAIRVVSGRIVDEGPL